MQVYEPDNQMPMTTVCLKKLISIGTQLTMEACKITQPVASVGYKHKIYEKGEDDHVTEVSDYQIQSLLTKGFRKHFPQLRIIGEETQQLCEDAFSEHHYAAELNDHTLPPYLKIERTLDTRSGCLWIDPIDCTRGFIKGNLEDVTILIGLTQHQRPTLGIIGTPFKRINQKLVYCPTVTVGLVQEQETYNYTNSQWQKLTKKPSQSPLVVCTSNTRQNKLQDGFIEEIKAKSILAGGSGRKIMMVVNGEADAMVYLDSWTHKWDSCAGDAIVRSMGGCFSTPHGSDIQYNEDDPVTFNREGMLVTLHPELHKQSLAIINRLTASK